MKILFVCPTLANGGAERVCVSWANGLIRLGHSVDILTKPNAEISYIPDKKVNVVQLPIVTNPLIKLIPLISEIYSLRKLIKRNNYDVVIEVLYYLYLPIRLATWLVRPKIPVVFTFHDSLERPKNVKLRLKSKIIRLYLNRLFDYITVLTNCDANVLKNKGYSKVSVLHNPLFLEPQDVNPLVKQKVVLSVGRVNSWFYKGFDILIKAWNIVYTKHPEWKLHIIGNASSSSLKYLQALIEDENSVEFFPFTPSIEDKYSEASIYCLSSRYEAWGLVAVEAMSRGCATIACNFRGRQAEFIQDGQTGILCEPDNIEDLANKLENLISNENLRLTLQGNAPKSLGEFHEDIVAKKLEKIILKLYKDNQSINEEFAYE